MELGDTATVRGNQYRVIDVAKNPRYPFSGSRSTTHEILVERFTLYRPVDGTLWTWRNDGSPIGDDVTLVPVRTAPKNVQSCHFDDVCNQIDPRQAVEAVTKLARFLGTLGDWNDGTTFGEHAALVIEEVVHQSGLPSTNAAHSLAFWSQV